MTVLLATHTVDILRADTAQDEHGWTVKAFGARIWTGRGNLQLDPPTAATAATDLGGSGPFEPRHIESGTLYLPPDAPMRPGDVAAINGRRWLARTVRVVPDPVGWADSLVVSVTELAEVVTG